MKKHLQLTFLGIFLLLVQNVNAQPIRTLKAKSTPLIDGHYNYQEWSDADTASINLIDGRFINVKFKRDNTAFYFVFYGPIASYGGGYAMFPEVAFDPLHNKGNVWQSDDQWFHVSYTDCSNIGLPDVWANCIGTQPDWTGIPNFSMSLQPDTIEMAIPFAKLQLNIQTTDTIGFCLMTNTSTGTPNDIVRTWPQSSNKQIPQSWAKIVIDRTIGIRTEATSQENPNIWFDSQLDKININFYNTKCNIFKAQIFDITGKQLIQIGQKIYDDFTSINVSHLKSGIYFVQLKTEDNTKTIKFIKR
ncbi:MAG: T9SS type A sorting domain-containing protein [Bacteroidales bacterium]